MSVSYDRGRTFERKVASILRSKLGARVERDRRSGAGLNKADISDWNLSIPLHLELKDQENIKVKEWFRQADGASSMNQAPTVVFGMEEEILACLRLSDLVNFLAEIKDQQANINDLKSPVIKKPEDVKERVGLVFGKKLKEGHNTCIEGHLADKYGFCMQKGCKYSRGYKMPKGKVK